MQQHKQLGLCSLVASLLPVICWSLPSSTRGKRSTLLEDHQRYYGYKHIPRGITSLLYPSNMNIAVDDDVTLGEPDMISMLAKRSARSRLMRNFRSGCPLAADGQPKFRCPLSRDQDVCIDDHQVCNGRTDCPQGEDEEPTSCMFYHVTNSHLRLLMQTLIGRGFLKK